tara:strand:- start:1714 stop:2037 length:324 start_codon:yes stop_codon:yes gene_type:complete
MESTNTKPNNSRKVKYTTEKAAISLILAMESAIKNMTSEIQRPVDQELTGSARKAELQAIKDTALACKELIIERQKLEELVSSLGENGEISKEIDYRGGFAEKFVRK